MRIICHLRMIHHIGGVLGLPGNWDGCDRDIRPSRPNRHTTPFSISTYTPPPAQSAMPRSPPIYSINKPRAGPRQRIMVHLEVTGKENRALCITHGDRDKHGAKHLGILIKDYPNMSETGYIFLFFFKHAEHLSTLLSEPVLQVQHSSAEIAMLLLCFCGQIHLL